MNLSEDQIRELAYCSRSSENFAETFGWLQQKASAGVSESSAIIPFVMGKSPEEPHYFQREILKALQNRENIAAFKVRRVGCSWVATFYAAWLVNFHEGVNILFISENGLKAKQILEKVKFILNNLAYHDHENIRKATPAPWLKGEIGTDNIERLSIVWRNDDGSIRATSDILSLNNTDNTGAGDDATFILFDELALYDHPDDTWASAMPTLTLGGHWMAVSTPRGIGDVFHRLCAKGDLYELGKLDEPIDFRYFKIRPEDAGITDLQIRKITEGWTHEKINREWNLTFTPPGTVAFNPTHLAVCYRPLKENPDIANFLAEYHDKVETGKGQFFYYSGADTSRAKKWRKKTEKDYHAFCALTGNGIQAGAYASKEELSKWAGAIIDDGAGGEVRTFGQLSKLHGQFPGILYIEEDGPGLVAATNHQTPRDGFSDMAQVSMSHYFKRGIVERFTIKIENHLVTITDPFTYHCLSVFQNLGNGKYGAPEGYYDDPVLAMLLASAALDAYGMMDIPWGTAVGAKPIQQTMQEEDMFTSSGPMLQLNMPAETARASEIIRGPTYDLGDVEKFKWMVTEDENNFEKVIGNANLF